MSQPPVGVRQLIDAVKQGETARVRTILQINPDLVHTDLAENDEHRALHYAVLARNADMVRLLMQFGADARQGIYPHRAATTAHTLAAERGYHEIVSILNEEEHSRGGPLTSLPDELSDMITEGDETGAIALLQAHPSLIQTADSEGRTPLHTAAAARSETLVSWLTEHEAQGGDVNRAGPHGQSPLDYAVGKRWKAKGSAESFQKIGSVLRARGADLTARSAVALGETEWLRAHHAQGMLVKAGNWREGGLLTVAVKHKQPETLKLLLEFGFDANEPLRLEDLEEEVYSFGTPLWHAAALGNLALAELLLKSGADPNAMVYASGTPMYSAASQRKPAMIALLRQYGGELDAETVGHYRETDTARSMLAGATDSKAVAEKLLWSAACGGDPEIVRMALEQLDWAPDDERWFWVLGQPLRLWNHMDGLWANPALDRSTYTECFRLVLERCDPNLRHARFGRTMLHDVAAFSMRMTSDEEVAFTTMLLDAGARMDVRDDILLSTPLGWACRWGCVEIVKLLISRGADVGEADAEPWSTPLAWAEKRGHSALADYIKTALRP